MSYNCSFSSSFKCKLDSAVIFPISWSRPVLLWTSVFEPFLLQPIILLSYFFHFSLGSFYSPLISLMIHWLFSSRFFNLYVFVVFPIYSYDWFLTWSVSLSCVHLYDHMDCSPPDPSVCGVLQARILEWAATPSFIQCGLRRSLIKFQSS